MAMAKILVIVFSAKVMIDDDYINLLNGPDTDAAIPAATHHHLLHHMHAVHLVVMSFTCRPFLKRIMAHKLRCKHPCLKNSSSQRVISQLRSGPWDR